MNIFISPGDPIRIVAVITCRVIDLAILGISTCLIISFVIMWIVSWGVKVVRPLFNVLMTSKFQRVLLLSGVRYLSKFMVYWLQPPGL